MSIEKIKAKLDEKYDDLSTNITHIYNRTDLLMAIDLVFHSVLRFKFRRQWVNKGWVEGLILGDTREGKSESVERVIEHYQAGELCTAESTSFAGLIGGIQSLGRRNTITWGKIPLNDRRLVVLDETSGIPLENIGLFSGVRSSGVAQVTKIITERTMARTRILWCSNPRSGRKLETYNYGVLAVKELFGKTEDISRLDFAISVASGEVSAALIQRGDMREVEHKYTSEACAALVLWAWTRKDDEVVFTSDAEESILDMSEELSKKYSPQIPLVQPAEQRIKIARMAVSLACMLFSTDDGLRVKVKPEHALYIAWYLDQIYSKPSLAYDLYSKSHKATLVVNKELDNVLLNEYLEMSKGTPLTEVLLETGILKRSTLQDTLGWEKDDISRFTSWGIRRRLLKTLATGGLTKDPQFTILLKKARDIENPGGSVSEDIDIAIPQMSLTEADYRF